MPNTSDRPRRTGRTVTEKGSRAVIESANFLLKVSLDLYTRAGLWDSMSGRTRPAYLHAGSEFAIVPSAASVKVMFPFAKTRIW